MNFMKGIAAANCVPAILADWKNTARDQHDHRRLRHPNLLP